MRRELLITDLAWEDVMLQDTGYTIPIVKPEDIFHSVPQHSSGLLFVGQQKKFAISVENDEDDEFPFIASWEIDATNDPLWDAITKQIEEMF
ncbi:MAG: hypothetical protein PUF04_09710 [bacterium]|nr:hypothetical protein [bacterium]